MGQLVLRFSDLTKMVSSKQVSKTDQLPVPFMYRLMVGLIVDDQAQLFKAKTGHYPPDKSLSSGYVLANEPCYPLYCDLSGG